MSVLGDGSIVGRRADILETFQPLIRRAGGIAALAAELGTTEVTVWRWAAGKTEPSSFARTAVEAWAHARGIPSPWLVEPGICGACPPGWADVCHLPKGHVPPCLDRQMIEERDLITNTANGDMGRAAKAFCGRLEGDVIAALIARVKKAEGAALESARLRDELTAERARTDALIVATFEYGSRERRSEDDELWEEVEHCIADIHATRPVAADPMGVSAG